MFGSSRTQNQKRPSKIAVSAIVSIVAGAAIALTMTAIWGAVHKIAPFAARSQNGSHLTLLVFLGVATLLTIAVPAEFWERQRASEKQGFLATNDQLSELEDRRELFDSIEMEIKRSNRTHRPFALLRIQIDDLNRINSEYGDVVADKALCRLAQVLQAHCRELDTVVRYGDDEFAIVIPEAGPETVRQVTRRIRERFAGGRELPPLTINIGAARFGEDGKSIDVLLEAADRALYDVKGIASQQTSLCA
jgi:diguanylate cyclase (GGDEF)-like protein